MPARRWNHGRTRICSGECNTISTYEIEVYTKNYLEPLIGKYTELVKHLGSEEAAKDYLLAKHGLERNEKRNDAPEA